MLFPRLVVPFTQSTSIDLSLEAEGIDEDGAPIQGEEWSGNCNWQDHSKTVWGKDRATTEVLASVYIDGDPFPEMSHIVGGTAWAFGEEREIVSGSKARNPDGTVNYTRLDLR